MFVGQNVDDAVDAVADGAGIPTDPERLAANARIADWFEKFWKDYLSALQLDDMQQPKPAKPARSTNILLPQPPGGSHAWISAYLARSQNEGGVFLTFGRSLASAADLYEALYSERDEIAKAVPDLSWQRGADGKVWIQVPTIALGDLDDPDNRAKVVGYLAAQSNAMVNAFRHRLERLCKDRVAG